VTQLVEALGYRPEGRGFYSLWSHNPSCCTMVLASDQSVTEMSTRSIYWGGKGGRCV